LNLDSSINFLFISYPTIVSFFDSSYRIGEPISPKPTTISFCDII